MEVQPQLVLLQKTLFAVEGLGRQLDPELDLWATAKPFLEQWIREQMGPKALFKHLRENMPFFVEQLPHMPRLINDLLLLSKEQKMHLFETQRPRKASGSSRIALRKGFWSGVFSVTLVFGGLSYFKSMDHKTLAMVAFGTALAGGMIALLYGNKNK